ncbi:hypothetical protein VNO78_13052 [Psophocarpus tetragonolobus]|uniref:Transmembrane protein n=1 Tax=Psophocarpus tetragonolobus TaxID=3891 RepID=A0AAN9SRV3_PSOTE
MFCGLSQAYKYLNPPSIPTPSNLSSLFYYLNILSIIRFTFTMASQAISFNSLAITLVMTLFFVVVATADQVGAPTPSASTTGPPAPGPGGPAPTSSVGVVSSSLGLIGASIVLYVLAIIKH